MDRERLAWEALTRALLDGVVLALVWCTAVGLRAAWPSVWGLDLFPGEPVVAPLDAPRHLVLALLAAPLGVGVLAARRDLTPPAPPTVRLPRLLVSMLALATLLVTGLFLLDVDGISRPVVVAFTLLAAPALSLARRARRALRRRRPREADGVVLVGTRGEAEALVARLDAHPEWALTPVARLGPPASGDPLHRGDRTALREVLRRTRAAEVVVVGAAPAVEDLVAIARACDELGVRLSLDANFLGLRVGHAQVRDLDGYGVVSFAATPGVGLELAVKRVMDIVGAVAGLVLVGPLLGALALAVRLQDGGPAFFVQERCGLHGRTFPMLKLRTMRVSAEAEREALEPDNELDGPVFKLRRDPRVTPLGRWLRRSSLDELPQLVNVLLGHMSLVGPRPPLPDEVARYEPWQLRRLSMRPGLTGLWQVSGRSALPFDRWMALDLAYIDRWSLGLDVRLLLRTLPAVLSGRGAW